MGGAAVSCTGGPPGGGSEFVREKIVESSALTGRARSQPFVGVQVAMASPLTPPQSPELDPHVRFPRIVPTVLCAGVSSALHASLH